MEDGVVGYDYGALGAIKAEAHTCVQTASHNCICIHFTLVKLCVGVRVGVVWMWVGGGWAQFRCGCGCGGGGGN